MKHTPVLLALAICLVGTGEIASAQTPPESLRACARMQAPTERLQCYDTQMAALGVVVATPAVPTAPSTITQPSIVASVVTPPPPPPPSAEMKFGEDTLKSSKRPAPSASDKVMQSTISSIKEVRPKMFLIVLANGQIWLQEGTQITMFFHAGYDVNVEKGLMSGDYRMWTAQTGAKNWVRVTRIQ
ncbi:MAG TPA: hypothetical protein VHW25_18695 [Steroidobacteraceae bacterium]|jgi:hypothetical protein|nr:hypothetical protein [Steroidobacteraceae bacterium]